MQENYKIVKRCHGGTDHTHLLDTLFEWLFCQHKGWASTQVWQCGIINRKMLISGRHGGNSSILFGIQPGNNRIFVGKVCFAFYVIFVPLPISD